MKSKEQIQKAAEEFANERFPNSKNESVLDLAKELYVVAYRQVLKDNSDLNIIELEAERLEWSMRVFTEATPISSLRKLETEIQEIEADILAGEKVPMEYADALMCLFDSAGRQGISVEEILQAYKQKLKINKNRIWVKNPDNTYSHTKI